MEKKKKYQVAPEKGHNPNSFLSKKSQSYPHSSQFLTSSNDEDDFSLTNTLSRGLSSSVLKLPSNETPFGAKKLLKRMSTRRFSSDLKRSGFPSNCSVDYVSIIRYNTYISLIPTISFKYRRFEV